MALQDVLSQIGPEHNDLIAAELGRRSLLNFIPQYWPMLEPQRRLLLGWPIEAMADHLTAISNGQITRLIMNVPPGTMKSLMTRVFWPTWEWTQNPSLRFIGASYAHHLAVRDNRRSRIIVNSELYQRRYPHVRLSDDQATKDNFANTETGWMFATSSQGLATGERGDRFIIDDPHNITDVESPAVREKTLQWFAEVVPSRLNDNKSAIIVIMQRSHENDVTGYALSRELGYEHLMIPMHYDPERAKKTSIGWKDPRKKRGDLMWPERFSVRQVEELHKSLGPYASAAQLQQLPVPREGGLFTPDNLVTITRLPQDKIDWVRAWDLAASEGRGAWTVGALLGRYRRSKRYVIADIVRGRFSSGEVREKILATAAFDGPKIPIVIPQDPGQAGKAQAASIIADLSGFNARSELQSGSKETRAEPLAAQIEAGNVDMLKAGWNGKFVEEMRGFPRGTNKDQVDAASSAFNFLNSRKKVIIPNIQVFAGTNGWRI